SKAASITYGEEPYTSDETACLWFDILVQADSGQASHIEDFNRWIASLKRSLYTSTITHLARLAARQGTMEQQSLGYASRSYALTRDERGDAAIKASTYVDLARAVLTVSKSEAAAYFDEAV